MLPVFIMAIENDDDRTFVAELYARCQPAMQRRALSILKNESDAEEAVHEAILRVIRHLEKVRMIPRDEVLYYLVTVTETASINDAETVSHGCTFLQIICLTCPTSTFIFFAITVFQATGKRAQPIFLSLVRKGTTDVLLMPLFYHLIGINGVAWASPAADLVGVLIALAVLLPYLRRLRQMPASPAPEHS